MVTSRVGLWFSDHSTPNPFGIVPNPKITKIVRGSKFDNKGAFVIVEQHEDEEVEEKKKEEETKKK